MGALLATNSEESLKSCIESTAENMSLEGAKLTYVALKQFKSLSKDRPSSIQDTPLKEAVVRTGAYYFGPMFVFDKGTGIPSSKILNELELQGFYTDSLRFLNNAQLNLFFITLKCRGLVTDRQFLGYVKYGVK